jgi:hypothetical protein
MKRPSHTTLRRSQRAARQTPLFPGLVPMPTKSKPRQKSTVTPKALKMAIEEAGLADKLEQEAIAKAPLEEEIVAKIRDFVSMPATQGTTQPHPTALQGLPRPQQPALNTHRSNRCVPELTSLPGQVLHQTTARLRIPPSDDDEDMD